MAAPITADGFPTDLAANVAWARSGTAFFLETVAGLSDDDLDAPSGLPGWTRRYVCAHVARNAEGLSRLLDWARTGVENAMYPSVEAREAGIAASAGAPGADLRADLVSASEAFLRDCDAMPPASWQATVATMVRPIPAVVVPWYRVREVWIHAVDLGASATFGDVPVDVAEALITELATGLGNREAADLHLVATETGREWLIGAATTRVETGAGELASWLTGRTTRPEAELPPWI